VFTRSGGHALDASIMDGRDRACGAVAGVSTVRHPITLARRVMERTPYVLLAGPGAEEFADIEAVERVDPAWFDTERRRRSLREFLAGEDDGAPRGTVGVVARDRAGDLAAGTSTGGLTGKRWGRIGDSPIVGAGTWASNGTCAVSATGTGEEFIRHAVGRTIAALVEFDDLDCADAAARVIEETLAPGDGGVIVVDAAGRASFAFNTAGMLRGAADSGGRFEIAIWE
jgi:beta-aspartyl-peptidase (threonine type)